MVKGRNSKVTSIRWSDDVYTMIEAKARNYGMSVSEWIKEVVTLACSVNTPVNTMMKPDSVNTNETSIEIKTNAELVTDNAYTEPEPYVYKEPEVYNPNKRYEAGTMVKILKGRTWVTVPVPELDGDGNAVPQY